LSDAIWDKQWRPLSPPWREAKVTLLSRCNANAGFVIPRQSFVRMRQLTGEADVMVAMAALDRMKRLRYARASTPFISRRRRALVLAFAGGRSARQKQQEKALPRLPIGPTKHEQLSARTFIP
jgi:hypothetical protein